MAALIVALPSLWEGVTLLSVDRGRTVAALVSTRLPLGIGALMLALGVSYLRASRQDQSGSRRRRMGAHAAIKRS